MARARRIRAPRRRPARKAPARKRVGKKPTAKQYATIQETVEYADMTSGINLALAFRLNQFDRASKLATNFRWYKASKVVWSLEPLYNSYEDNGGDTVPYLYKIMDRTQDNLSMNLLDFQASGCKPMKLTSKKTFSFTPNWCSAGLTTFTENPTGGIINMTSQGLKAQYAWLAAPHSQGGGLPDTLPDYIGPLDPRTTPLPANSGMNSVSTNAVLYNGMDIIIDQAHNLGRDEVCRIVATVTWQFKDPKHNGYVREYVEPIKPKYPLLDISGNPAN